MNEKQIYENIIDKLIADNEYESFDQLIFKNYFDNIAINIDLTRIKTDSYGDAGNDYIFFTFNKRLILSIEDIEDVGMQDKNNQIDMYFVQVKDTSKLDSQVPDKFLEFTHNLMAGKKPEHYNEEVNENIDFFTELSTNYVLKAKFYPHFYYFSKVSKEQLNSAKDIIGRFNTLKDVFAIIDFMEQPEINIETVNSIVKKIREDKDFEYDFMKIDKFQGETDENSTKTNSIIALIPLKQYYNFITDDNDQINDKLFESNIRDYKGRSNVNKNIIETLESEKDLDFWWLNNGITITVEDLTESMSAKRIHIVNPQIVNGLQTSYSIYHYFHEHPAELEKEERKLFVKILKIIPELSEDDELKIIVATNSQNEIRDKDIHANDKVQKNIEQYLLQQGKYYQRKDKYYTNRRHPQKDIVKLADMAKYINTIYLKDPSFTRNNPGKLLNGSKYEAIFKTKDTNQDYERYYLAYLIYNKVSSLTKGQVGIGEDDFDKVNFIHHIVYISICLYYKKIDYSPTDIKNINIDNLDQALVNKSIEIIITTIKNNKISNAKILKSIKEQDFKRKIDECLKAEFQSEE